MFVLAPYPMLTYFLVALVIGMGWTLGCWIMARLLGLIVF